MQHDSRDNTGNNKDSATKAPAVPLMSFLIQCPGLTGEIARYINSCLETDQPGIALATSLAFVSALKAGRIRSGSMASPSLYTCAVAGSGAGKSRAQQIVTDMCVQAGLKRLLMGRPASDAGILSRLQITPRQFLIWDEFGLALEEMSKSKNSYRVSIISTIMDLYSASGRDYIGREYADKDRIDIEKPCLSICASTTPGKFYSVLSKDFIENGFLNRWLVFDSLENLNFRNPSNESTPLHIIEGIEEIELGREREFGSNLERLITKREFDLTLDSETSELMKLSRWDKLSTSQNETESTLWMRCKENAIRVCMTLSDNDGNCSEEIASYAWSLIETLTESLIARCENDIVEQHDKINVDRSKKFKSLINIGETVTQSQLTKRASNAGFQRREREDRTKDLLETEEWIKSEKTTFHATKPTTSYTRRS